MDANAHSRALYVQQVILLESGPWPWESDWMTATHTAAAGSPLCGGRAVVCRWLSVDPSVVGVGRPASPPRTPRAGSVQYRFSSYGTVIV